MNPGQKWRRRPLTGHFYGQFERDYCAYLRQQDAPSVRIVAKFNLILAPVLVFAPLAFDLPLVLSPALMAVFFAMTVMVAAIDLMTPWVRLIEVQQIVAGVVMTSSYCILLSQLPEGHARVYFSIVAIHVLVTYFSPGLRLMCAMVSAVFSTVLYGATYVLIHEAPSLSGRFVYMGVVFALANLLGFVLAQSNDRKNREIYMKSELIDVERRETKRLVRNILPDQVALRLETSSTEIADDVPEASVLFADLVGFTKMASRLSAREVVRQLSQLFSRFDDLTERFQVEKIKTIGDAYMVAGGVPTYRTDHLHDLLAFALAMQDEMIDFNREAGVDLKLRIGVHVGPVIAGVLGTKKFSYDLWGDTVNLASRIESVAASGTIAVSEAVMRIASNDYEFLASTTHALKGKGDIPVYRLVGRLAAKISS